MNAFSFDPDGSRIAIAHGGLQCKKPRLEDYVMQIWDVATGAALAVLAGHSADVWDVSFSPDGQSLLSASRDGSTKIWDTNSWEQTAWLEEGEKSAIARVLFSPDGKYIATASLNGAVRLWRVGNASCTAVFTEHTTDVWHVAFTPDSEFLASGDNDGIVYIRRISDFIWH